jgi:hypothetical protein
MGKAERDMYLDMYWDDLREELLHTRDPRKELLVDAMDDVMESYRAKLLIRCAYGREDNGIHSDNEYSVNAI